MKSSQTLSWSLSTPLISKQEQLHSYFLKTHAAIRHEVYDNHLSEKEPKHHLETYRFRVMTQTNPHCTNKAKDLWQIFSKKESSFSTEPIKTIKTNVQLRDIRLVFRLLRGRSRQIKKRNLKSKILSFVQEMNKTTK